jgi:hypothetical protein
MVLSLVSALTGLTGLAALAALPQAFAMNVSNVLIYSYTAGFRHDSIPTAVASMMARGSGYGINFVNSEDPSQFSDEWLSQFDALLFLDNTDEGQSHQFASEATKSLEDALLCVRLLYGDSFADMVSQCSTRRANRLSRSILIPAETLWLVRFYDRLHTRRVS